MSKLKQVRLVGTVLAVSGCILYICGAMTDHWAENSETHYGLWNYCKNMTTYNSSSTNTFVSSTTFSSVTTQSLESSSTLEIVKEDEFCEQFSFSAIPADFHLVRAFVVCGTILLAYTVLTGRLLRQPIESRSNFISTHRGEMAGILGGLLGFVGIRMFITSFKTYNFDDYGEPSLGISAVASNIGCIIIICGAILMTTPTLNDIIRNWRGRPRICFSCFSISSFKSDCRRCLPFQSTQRPPATEPVSSDLGMHRNSVSSVDDEDTADADTISLSNVFTVDVEDSSSSSPYLAPRRSPFLNPEASQIDPAPRYEDLSPAVGEDVPPPPSYDEAVSGQYAIGLASRGGVATSASPASPTSIVISDSVDSPPPGYDETVA